MPSDKSILFFMATTTAAMCSHALPAIGSTIMPRNACAQPASTSRSGCRNRAPWRGKAPESVVTGTEKRQGAGIGLQDHRVGEKERRNQMSGTLGPASPEPDLIITKAAHAARNTCSKTACPLCSQQAQRNSADRGPGRRTKPRCSVPNLIHRRGLPRPRYSHAMQVT